LSGLAKTTNAIKNKKTVTVSPVFFKAGIRESGPEKQFRSYPSNMLMSLAGPNQHHRMIILRGMVTFILLFAAIWGFVFFIFLPFSPSQKPENVVVVKMIAGWKSLSGGKKGKVVFAVPPHIFILDLGTGRQYKIPGITVEGGRGRKMRGLTPRPFWSPDGRNFIYRTRNRIYVSDTSGKKKAIFNPQMNSGKESRWSWWREDGTDWAVGPSKTGNIILVKIDDPSITRTVYSGGNVVDWCEMTGNGKYVVYDTGSDIFVSPTADSSRRIKISHRQSCRPCAAPDNRVAWLGIPHDRYWIYNAVNGEPIGELMAPPGEQIYRLNWSNLPDFAVHMFGSEANQRMHVRRISTGERLFIGYGWDPDLWVE
jgi:hypothetical protein